MTAAKVDETVQQILQERYEYTRQCLDTRRAVLNALVAALMEHETVLQEEMKQIIGPRP